jgi:hypothetical protein
MQILRGQAFHVAREEDGFLDAAETEELLNDTIRTKSSFQQGLEIRSVWES